MPPESVMIGITTIASVVTTILTKVKCYFKSSINPCICGFSDIPIDQYEVTHAIEPSIDTKAGSNMSVK